MHPTGFGRMKSQQGHPGANPDLLPALARSRNRWVWSFWTCGMLMVAPPLVGVVRIVMAMLGASQRVARTGKGDPAGIARDISEGMLATMVGLGVSFLALIGFVLSLVMFLRSNRELRERDYMKIISLAPEVV